MDACATIEVINLTVHLARRALIAARATLRKAELQVVGLREVWYRERERDQAVNDRWALAITTLADARGAYDRAARVLHEAIEAERHG